MTADFVSALRAMANVIERYRMEVAFGLDDVRVLNAAADALSRPVPADVEELAAHLHAIADTQEKMTGFERLRLRRAAEMLRYMAQGSALNAPEVGSSGGGTAEGDPAETDPEPPETIFALRPMSEAPRDGTWFYGSWKYKWEGRSPGKVVCWKRGEAGDWGLYGEGAWNITDDFAGWLPLPEQEDAENELDAALVRLREGDVEALDELLADSQSEARSHADAAQNYARELQLALAREKRLAAVVGEMQCPSLRPCLVEECAGDETGMTCQACRALADHKKEEVTSE